jgi:hypothetical protein
MIAASVVVTRRNAASFAACPPSLESAAARVLNPASAVRCALLALRSPLRSRSLLDSSSSNSGRACHHN